jgi:DNA (cytosine-5)-methyltransferase 1
VADRNENHTAVVLFCGAGGSSVGLEGAGFRTVGFDYWQPAVDTHNANGMPAHLHDLSDAELDDRLPDAPLFWLSPPCQPFSAAGAGEGEFDDRDGFPWALRILARKLPTVAIIENVKGLTFDKHRAYFSGVLASLRELGYEVDWRVLMCADFGVPQTRERCIIICRRDGGRITWPMPTHTEHAGMFTERWVSMLDALPHLPAELVARHQRGSGMIERHGERPDRPLTAPAMTVRQGGGGDPGGFVLVGNNTIAGGDLAQRMSGEPALTLGTRCDLWKWIETRPATTIAGDTRVFQPGGHHQPGEQSQNAIQLTIPELAALQGFPPDYVWTGSKTAQARQVGNAVPPALAQVLAEANRPLLALSATCTPQEADRG